jgi:hypothetical protein
MKAKADVEPGICGLRTTIWAESADDRHVTFRVESDCEKVLAFGRALAERRPVDAFAEIGGRTESVVLGLARYELKGCCAGCVTPVGVFKAMQVAAGVALPKDVVIRLGKEA